jgi:hypothetical protein
MATLEIHRVNPLFDMHPKAKLRIGLSAIYSVPLEAYIIIVSGIAIHIRI